MAVIENYSAPSAPNANKASGSDFFDPSGHNAVANVLNVGAEILQKKQLQNDTIAYQKQISQLRLDSVAAQEILGKQELKDGETRQGLYQNWIKSRLAGVHVPNTIRT
jgi:hypothetical protein